VNTKLISVSLAATLLTAASGCRDEPPAGARGGQETAAPAEAPTNRIDLPPVVRQNLGITFATVERRQVASTLRVPGRFELLPTSRQEYRTAVPGFVRLLVSQYQQIEEGEPISRTDSPEWHRIKKELHEAEVGIERATAELLVAQRTKDEAEQVAEALRDRVESLAGAEVRRADLETELMIRRAAIPRLEAEIRVRQSAVTEAKHDLHLSLARAASLLGVSEDFLRATEDGANGHVMHRWYTINQVEVPARNAGLVEIIGVTDGAWVEANTLIATTIDPSLVRFRAMGMQSDLSRLAHGLPAQIVPPRTPGVDLNDSIPATLMIGPEADPDQRTVTLLATPEQMRPWVRPGVSAFLEIVTESTDGPSLAIPRSAIVKDGITHVFFRRDPSDPNKAIRVEADMGVSDGRWVAIHSGLMPGDEVVLDGAYELKLASEQSGVTQRGGHFHADGTFHGDH
jgi:multidrug efflux pump subunit AcrA (membrane-fusion protein)